MELAGIYIPLINYIGWQVQHNVILKDLTQWNKLTHHTFDSRTKDQFKSKLTCFMEDQHNYRRITWLLQSTLDTLKEIFHTDSVMRRLAVKCPLRTSFKFYITSNFCDIYDIYSTLLWFLKSKPQTTVLSNQFLGYSKWFWKPGCLNKK